MDAVRGLRDSGLRVEDLTPAGREDLGVDAILDVAVGDRSERFAVQAKSRAPYPHEVERLRRSRPEVEDARVPSDDRAVHIRISRINPD